MVISRTKIEKLTNVETRTLNEYIIFCKKHKVSHFFIKNEMLLRCFKQNIQTSIIFRCSRWVTKEDILVPEWFNQVYLYQRISNLTNKNLKIILSVFDTKNKDNIDMMFKYRFKFNYSISGSLYKNEVVVYKKLLDLKYLNDPIYRSKFDNIAKKERAKFKEYENLSFYFAELCAAVNYSYSKDSTLFIHDTQRVSLVKYLEKICFIPKIGYLPIIRKNMQHNSC